jgi:outer membrane protein assembly factor BamB
MRNWRRVAIISTVVLSVGLFAPLVALVNSAGASGSLTLSVTSGSAGTRVRISGQGFTTGEEVQPYWGYVSASNPGVAQKSFYLYDPIVPADNTGSAITDFFVPVVPGGTYTVALVGLTSGAVDTASFQVVPRLDTGSLVAPAGTTLRLTGWDFGPYESVSIISGGTTLATAKTDSKGFLHGKTYTIPSSTPSGPLTITATGLTSGDTASTTVTVGPVPTGPSPGADDWPNWGWDLQQHRVNPNETTIGASNVSGLGLAWQQAVSAPDTYQASPSVANGLVYIGSVKGLLSAYNATTGALQWSFQANGPIYGSPTIVNGIAYFGTVNEPQEEQAGNYAYALNATTGAVIWANALPNGGEWVPPVVTNGVAYFTMANREAVSGGMVAYDALTGETIWEDNTPFGVWSDPAVDPSGQYLYQGTGNPCFSEGNPQPGDGCSGYILKVNAATGTYTTLLHTPDFSGDDDVATAVTYDNGNLYFGGKDGYFYSISPTTGAINWETNTGYSGDFGIYSSAAVYDGLVIFGSMGGRDVWALNESNGSVAWQYTIGGEVAASPVVANGVVYVASYSKQFAALNPSTGALLWSTTLQAPSGGSAAVADGYVYQSVGNGALDAFTLGSQKPSFSSANATMMYAGNTGSFTVMAAGEPAPSISESGALPSGLSFSNSGAGTAKLSGTAANGTQGTYPITFTATNGSGTVVQSFTLTIAGTPAAFTSGDSSSATVGEPFSYSVTATGVPTPVLFATSGTLPPGITFTDDGGGNGTLSGTPTSSGDYTIVLNAHNGVGSDAVQDFSLAISGSGSGTAPSFTADNPPSTAGVGVAFSYTFAANGNPAPTFSVQSGSIPPGLSLSTSGILSGTPTTAGSYTFVVNASNGVGVAATSPSLTITVLGSADIATKLSGPAHTSVGSMEFDLTVSNLGPSTAEQIVATFTLPSGTAFSSAESGGSYSDGVVTWMLSSLASGSHVNLYVTITSSAPGTYVAEGDANAANPDPNPSNNESNFTSVVKA